LKKGDTHQVNETKPENPLLKNTSDEKTTTTNEPRPFFTIPSYKNTTKLN